MKKSKLKTFGALRKPSGRVVIEGLTPWHVDHLNDKLSHFCFHKIESKKMTDQVVGWAGNSLVKRLQDRTIKTIGLNPMEVGLLILALAIYDDIPWVNLKSQLHRYML